MNKTKSVFDIELTEAQVTEAFARFKVADREAIELKHERKGKKFKKVRNFHDDTYEEIEIKPKRSK